MLHQKDYQRWGALKKGCVVGVKGTGSSDCPAPPPKQNGFEKLNLLEIIIPYTYTNSFTLLSACQLKKIKQFYF